MSNAFSFQVTSGFYNNNNNNNNNNKYIYSG